MDYGLTDAYPIWKLESDDPEINLQGEFAMRYMLSAMMRKTFYLGHCGCPMSKKFRTPIISFKPVMECVFCGKEVELQPVPRWQEGKWILESICDNE